MMKGYRTYLASLSMLAVGVLAEVLAGTDWQKFMVDPKTGTGLIVGAVVMGLMRKITTTPPGKSDAHSDSE